MEKASISAILLTLICYSQIRLTNYSSLPCPVPVLTLQVLFPRKPLSPGQTRVGHPS